MAPLLPRLRASNGDADPPDSALVERTVAGDRKAFDVLVRRYLARAYRVAYRLMGNREDAEDLVQESFLAAFRAIDTFDTARPFDAWFFRILTNRGLSAQKARKVRATVPIPETEIATDRPDRLAERAEVRARFEAALAELPPRQRLVIQLFEVEGYETSEIAGMLDTSVATVRWYLFQGRRRLRTALAPIAPAREA